MSSSIHARRYERQTQLRWFGVSSQDALSQSHVLVIGAGGLGAPLLQLLCGAGVGTIDIVDSDVVDIMNLHRQTLYTEDEVGTPKAMCAAQRLQKINSQITVRAFHESFHARNAHELIRDVDLVVDCSDNFQTRYCINDACVLWNKPWVYGAVQNRELQLAVFNEGINNDQRSASLRCVFPENTANTNAPNCERDGILGSVSTTASALMADLCLLILAGKTHALQGNLLLMSLDTMQVQILELRQNKSNWPESCKHEATFLRAHSLTKDNATMDEFPKNVTTVYYEDLQFMTSRHARFPRMILEISEGEPEEGFYDYWRILPPTMLRETVAALKQPTEIAVMCERGIRSRHWVTILAQEFPQHSYMWVKPDEPLSDL